MENGSNNDRAKYAVLALLSMRAANPKYFNGMQHLSMTALRDQVSCPLIVIPDEMSHTSVKQVKNPCRVTKQEAAAALGALKDGGCIAVYNSGRETHGTDYIITEQGEKELAAMKEKMVAANGVAVPVPTATLGR